MLLLNLHNIKQELTMFFRILKLFLLIFFMCNKIETVESFVPHGLLFDITTQIKGIISGKVSREDFAAAVESNPVFQKNRLQNVSLQLFYASDCNVFKEQDCTLNIARDFVVINHIFGGINAHIDLTISLTVTTSELLDVVYPKPLHNLSSNVQILLNLQEINCEDLLKINISPWYALLSPERWIFPTRPSFGFGFNQPLIKCNKEVLSEAILRADFVVVSMTFGNTIGVPESFGLFQQNMNALHEQTVKFIEDKLRLKKENLPKIGYYPIPRAVGHEEHRRLLESYAEKWTSDAGIGVKSMIVQIPYLHAETDSKEFSLMPDIFSEYCYLEHNKIKSYCRWYMPSALAAISKHFNGLILTHNQWAWLNSTELQLTYDSINVPNSDNIRLDVFIDFSEIQLYPFVDPARTRKIGRSRSYNWTDVEHDFEKTPIQPLKNVVAKVLIFTVSQIGNVSKAQIPRKLAQQASTNLLLACQYLYRYTESFNFAKKASSVVSECKEFGGRIYILDQNVFLDLNDHENFYLYYEYRVRGVLEAANAFRKEILKRHPTATVYLKLTSLITFVRAMPNKQRGETVICNAAVLKENLFMEAIVNWAKINNFPLIMNTAFEYLDGFQFISWLSPLSPKPKGALSSEDQQSFAARYPLFALRNYPTGINNWTVDPCIEWSQDVPDLNSDYFHNPYIGAIFNTNNLRKKPLSGKDFNMMLQFISHTFLSTEIAFDGKSDQEILDQLDLLTSNQVIKSTQQFFISYPLKSETGFRNFLTELGSDDKPYLEGVHVDFQNTSVVTEQIQILISWAEKSNTKAGILLNMSSCVGMINNLVERQASATYTEIIVLLRKLNYIVCKDEFDVLDQDDLTNMGYTLDTHLYFKRVFEDFQPHLQFYFRLELNIILNKDKESMEPYLRAISRFYQFGVNYDIKYFLVEAFDGIENTTENKNGWWTIQNATDMTNPYSYIQKESAYSKRSQWFPPVPAKTDTKIVTKSSKVTIIVASVSSIFLVILLASSSVLFMRYKRLSSFLSDEEVKEFLHGRQKLKENSGENVELTGVNSEYMKFKNEYELARTDLIIDIENILGIGNYGIVYKGLAKGKAAAIKKPNNNCPKEAFKNVLFEVKVLCYIGNHPNLVGFLGAYVKEINKGVLYIATELCSNGSLESYLRTKTHVVERQDTDLLNTHHMENSMYYQELYHFSGEIANGMGYIESKCVVHGDLSARNVFLDENHTCKIGDFGLSRKIYEYQKYVKKSQDPLPWKWLAYESLTKMEFTSKSDVWSYGILLWEIYSLGAIPYGGLNWSREFADELRNGLRLTRPEFASEEIYAKMLECWNLDVEQRPRFKDLEEFFKQFCRVDYTVLSE